MTKTKTEPQNADRSAPASTRAGNILTDSLTEAGRHLRVLPRNVEVLVFSTVQPIMFILLFSVVFGGEIEIPGFAEYNQYLMPGIFAQTIVFGTSFTGVGIAEDLSKGLIDRLRSLPISPAAVLVGRTLSDLVRNIITFVIMLAVAFALGFRLKGSLFDALLATALLLVFGYGLSWVQALIGLSVGSVEAASSAGFVWMFPMTFVSSAFISTDTLPGWLVPIADANPFTQITNASRALYSDNDPGNSVMWSLVWSFGMVAVFSLLATRKYNASSS